MNVLCSFPRSGRAWTLTICGTLNSLLPNGLKVRHTHDKATDRTYSQYRSDKSGFADHRVVLIIRDPRDVCVSHWHLLKFRARREPARSMDLFDWVMESKHGLNFVIQFLNDWSSAIDSGVVEDIAVFRYEDLKRYPHRMVRRIALAFGVPREHLGLNLIHRVVEETTLEKIREKFRHSNHEEDQRMWSARRGEVGAWREYFTEDQAEKIDARIRSKLVGFREFYL